METEAIAALPKRGGTGAEVEFGAAAHLVCRVARQLHAIPIDHVVEIMRVLPVEPIAGTPDYVRGLCIVRGTPLPVVDVGLLIGQRQTELGRLVAIKTGSRTIALQVDDVLGIRSFGATIFNDLPPLLRDIAADTLAGIGTLDSALLLVLRVARIVPDGLFDSMRQAGAPP